MLIDLLLEGHQKLQKEYKQIQQIQKILDID